MVKGVKMQVQRVQNNTNFTGNFLKTYSFKRLEQNLNVTEKASWKKIVSDVENTKDDYYWWFSFYKINNGTGETAHMGRLDPEGKPYMEAMFTEEVKTDSDGLKVFERLHKWYKENVKDYRGVNR